MTEFLTILRFELRKLLARRALWVVEALLCLIFWGVEMALLFGWGGVYLEYGVEGRGSLDFARRVQAAMDAADLTGRPMDAGLLTQGAAALEVLQSGQADPMKTAGYIPVFWQLQNLPDAAQRPAGWAQNFYEAYRDSQRAQMANLSLPEPAKAVLWDDIEKIPEPWPNLLPQAFRTLLVINKPESLVLAALGPVLVLLAGAFPKEYSTGVATLQRGTRYGRGHLAAAKLLAGHLTAQGLTALPLAGKVLLVMFVLGPVGSGAPVQLVLDTPYPLTLTQALALQLLCWMAAALALAAGAVLAGAVFGRAVPALVTVFVLFYMPVLLSLPGSLCDWWPSRFPARLFNLPPVSLGPVVLHPWTAFSLGCLLWAAAAGALAARRFARSRL